MKKKRSLIENIILFLILAPIILGILLIAGIFGSAYYHSHFSTEAKLQKYIKTNNIEKLNKLKLNINGYYERETLENIILGEATPLTYAIYADKAQVVNYLIEKGADVNLDATHGDRKFNTLGKKPLHIAAEGGNKEIVEILINNGANINAKDEYGETPLMSACKMGRNEVADFLIKNGANVNEKSNLGNSPLSLAKKQGHKEIAELLIANGAKE